MRAVVIDRFKTRGAVRDLPEPSVKAGEVGVRITYAGVNPIDWKIRAGEAGERPLPLVLGQDFAGVVLRVGADVRRVKVGDRVFGCARDHGSYAQETVIAEGQHNSPFSAIPSGVSDAIAAALPTPCLTALASLEVLGVTSGTTLLIVGAAGAVGCTASQMARDRGARITAVVRPGQEERARRFGANEVATSIEALTSRGADSFDAVLDLVSDGAELKKNAALVRKGGALVTTIHVADEAWFRERDITATNIAMQETPQSSPQGLDEVAQMVAQGRLQIEVTAEEPLAEAPSVLDKLAAGELSGKIVLVIDGTAAT